MGCNQSNQSKVSDVGALKQNPKPTNEQNDEKQSSMLTVPTPATRPKTPPPATNEDSYLYIRLLILGSAESGKTTLLEQVRLLYKQNFTESEMFHRRGFIYNNIALSIRSLVMAMQDNECTYEDPENQERAKIILGDDDSHYGIFNTDYAETIEKLWKDPAVQKLYVRRSAFNLNDSAAYFLNNLSVINQPNYKPTEKDLIMSYVPTVGVQNVVISIDNATFQLFDIGGQKIDRRKWATQYDGLDAIFFCIAISEYDQLMSEDMTTNRFDDALMLLGKISREPKFSNTKIYIFLNEIDVFCEKLSEIPLQEYQPSFPGGNDEDAITFMENLVVNAITNRNTSLYQIYRTIAIDSKMMKPILTDVFKDIKKRK